VERRGLKAKATAVVSPVLANLGYQLVEVAVVVAHGRRTLRVYIHKEGGIGLEDCARASRALGHVLDEAGVFAGRYFLEVSSPGAERRLRDRKDFELFTGRKASVRLREAQRGMSSIEGRIEGLTGDALRLKPEDGEEMAIPFENIARANLCL
jgi:ribosome maturation factor RimP